MQRGEPPLQSRVPGHGVRVAAQVIAQHALIPGCEGAGLDKVQMVCPGVISPAAVEQSPRHPGVVELVAQPAEVPVSRDNPIQAVGRCHQVDDRLRCQAGYSRAAHVLDCAEQTWQRGHKFGDGLAGPLGPGRVILGKFEWHPCSVTAAGPQPPNPAGYAPVVAYRGQFDHLVRAADRGRAVLNTRTVAVFDDGLVVCPVPVYGDAPKRDGGVLAALRRTGRTRGRNAGPGRGDEQVRAQAEAAGSSVTFAPTWLRAQLIPLAVIEKVVLTRPQQVSELAIYLRAGGSAAPLKSTYLGDLSPDVVRDTLATVLGERLEIDIPH